MEKFENPFLHAIAMGIFRLVNWSSNFQSLFLLWMRLTWGHQFFLVGLGKLADLDKIIQFFTTIGISHPIFCAHLVAYLETIGGLLLMFGLASRLIAIPLSIAMLAALSLAHAQPLSHFRFITEPSSLVGQPPYPFLITSMLVLFFGPGRISLDAWLKRWANQQPKY